MSQKKIEELLAVLDLGEIIISASSGKPVINIFDREEKQIEWLCVNNIIYHRKWPATIFGDAAHNNPSESLEDLAFRLRDESRKLSDDALADSLVLIYKKCTDKIDDMNDCLLWWVYNSKPIHWIIASLIVKEMEKDE